MPCFSHFFVGVLMFKMVSMHSAEVLSNVPKHKKAVKCPMEKIFVLGKRHSGMSYSAVWL